MHPARVYYVFAFTFNLSFSVIFVTYTLFLKAQGLTLSEIVVANAFFLGVSVLMELPTGMLADGRGRAWSLKMGIACAFIAACSYAFAHSLATAMVSEFFYGLGCAFFSGAEDAWIADALGKRKESDQLKRVLGTSTVFQQIGMIIGSGIGILIGCWNERIPWFCSGALMIIPFVWCLTRMNGMGEPEHRMTEIRALVSSVRALVGSRALAWMIAVESSLGLVFFFNLFWAISFDMRIGRGWLYGVWVVIQCSLLIGGWIVRTWTSSISAEAGMMLIMATTGGSLMVMASFDPFAIVLFALVVNESARGMFRSFATAYIQEKVESGFRATYGSLRSGLTGTIWMGIYLASAWLFRSAPATQASIHAIWQTSAALLIVASFILWIIRPKAITS